MSLDNIHLQPALMQSLYGKSLYLLNTKQNDQEFSNAPKIGFLGNNQKKIAVLVENEQAVYLPDDALNFLMGILTACKLSMADIALINLAHHRGTTYVELTEQLQTSTCILFGVPVATLQLPLKFPHYQIQQFNNQVYLSALSLSELQQDKSEKMKLWNCLKKIFSI
jgi:hypothetical protein